MPLPSTVPVLRPLHDRLIVRLITLADRTPGGILIPEAAKEKPLEAWVIAAGNGRVMDNGAVIPMSVKVGDKVLFAKFAGTEVKLGEGDHLILREEDVLAVMES